MSQMVGTVGQVLADRYRLIAPLGRGGMGSVWRAEHTSLGTPVAIKLIHPDLARREGMLSRFHREAQSAAKLRSVHVVQILDHGVHEGVPYIAMECLEGESLAQRLATDGPLTPAATAQVLAGVCRALTRAHRLGIVHRDLKPDNIFLAREETTTVVKVLDFGIAKLLDTSPVDESAETETAAALRTETGAMLGTPRHEPRAGARASRYRRPLGSLGPGRAARAHADPEHGRPHRSVRRARRSRANAPGCEAAGERLCRRPRRAEPGRLRGEPPRHRVRRRQVLGDVHGARSQPVRRDRRGHRAAARGGRRADAAAGSRGRPRLRSHHRRGWLGLG
ncbi:MAG: serine/threonine protein kinase [Polyangiaceae bacterium]|nr:serine/threonine protein kinase [Polyangiaceae bacterium]